MMSTSYLPKETLSSLRAAVRTATADPSMTATVEVDDGVTVWVRSEQESGFDRLFTVRARKGSRMLARTHWSAVEVQGFEFERVFRGFQ